MNTVKLSLIFFFFSLSFNAQSQDLLEIWEIQGSGAQSAYDNQTVSTEENIVTAIFGSTFWIQTPPNRSDNNPETSDGIAVYSGSTWGLNVGDLISLEATVQEYDGQTELHVNGEYNVIATGNDLPPIIELNENFPSQLANSYDDLETVEGMLVTIPDGHVCAPSNGGWAYISASGQRTFREPGIEWPGTSGLPVWDNNPERFLLDPTPGGGALTYLHSRTEFNAVGVISQSDDDYVFFPKDLTITEDVPIEGVRSATEAEATVGCLNCLGFSDSEWNYDVRLTKMANYVIELMGTPDILAVQEVESLDELEDLANQINAQNPGTNYNAFLVPAEDPGNFIINNGYLVKSILENVIVTQLGADEWFSGGGELHDRPPLLLEAEFPTTPSTKIQVLNLHLRSLNGIEGSSSNFVRSKRHAAAISVAEMVQDLQDQNLIVLGDFNAFQFSDGYVDVLAQISGQPSLGAEYEVENIVNPALEILCLTVPEEERYSYVYQGNAQVLDHALMNNLEQIIFQEMQFVRANSDNQESLYFYDESDLRCTSDHDGFVVFLELQNALAHENLETSINFQIPNPYQNGQAAILNLEKSAEVGVRVFHVDGTLVEQLNSKEFSAGQHHLSFDNLHQNGVYLVELQVGAKRLTQKIIVQH